jgi:hypothetical protein
MATPAYFTCAAPVGPSARRLSDLRPVRTEHAFLNAIARRTEFPVEQRLAAAAASEDGPDLLRNRCRAGLRWRNPIARREKE